LIYCFVGTSQVTRNPEDGGRTEVPDAEADDFFDLDPGLCDFFLLEEEVEDDFELRLLLGGIL